jgi:hypothetical protein
MTDAHDERSPKGVRIGDGEVACKLAHDDRNPLLFAPEHRPPSTDDGRVALATAAVTELKAVHSRAGVQPAQLLGGGHVGKALCVRRFRRSPTAVDGVSGEPERIHLTRIQAIKERLVGFRLIDHAANSAARFVSKRVKVRTLGTEHPEARSSGVVAVHPPERATVTVLSCH